MAAFHPFEVSAPHIIYVGLGAFICIFSYLSLFIKERLYLGEAPIAAAFGIIVGPIAIDLFNPARWGNESGQTPGGHVTDEITLEVMRVTVALSVFAIGVELPKKYLLRHWRSIAILLGPVMLWGWLITGLLIWAFVPGLDYLTSLVVAACVSPTDPILAQAVVGGPWADKHVPAHVRHMLMCESGCNDGAAFPFLYLALYLTQNRGNTGYAIGRWFYEAWAYEIILGTILGALIGFVARKFMRFSERHKLIDRESFVAQYISLAVVSMGVNVLLGSDDLLAAFACGTAFAWDGWFTKQTEDSNFSNIIDLLFNIATFIYIGALIPWHDFANAEIGLSVWRLIVLTILVLLLKRIPIILALWKWMPDIKTFREAVFSGHFGPMGVGAIFIATLGRTLMPEEVPENPETVNDVLANVIQPIVYFFVLTSIIVHGLTIPFFAFGKNAHRRAHTLTRTWSRNPSMAADEPGWMSRVRRVRTGDEIEISAEKLTAVQLAMIGRGAIGGPPEEQLRKEAASDESTAGEGDSSSGRTTGGGPFGGLLNRKTECDLEKAEGSISNGGKGSHAGDDDDEDEDERQRRRKKAEMDGVEDWDDDEHFNPSCDYLGDNCAEVKRYRARIAARREAKAVLQRQASQRPKDAQEQEQEQDLGEAPMDREIIGGRITASDEDEACRDDHEGQGHLYHDSAATRQQRGSRHTDGSNREGGANDGSAADEEEGEEEKFPRLREWVEGKQLVLEYQKDHSEDPVVQVIKLSAEEAEQLAEADSPSHKWLQHNKAEVGEILCSDKHHEWNSAETAHRLIEHGVPKFWGKKKRASVTDSSGSKGGTHGRKSAEEQEPCNTLEKIHSRIDERREGREGGETGSSSSQPERRAYAAATGPQEESRAERDERATMLFGAMTWARNNRDQDDDHVPSPSQRMVSVAEAGKPVPTPSGSSSRRSSTSFGGRRRSALTQPHQQQQSQQAHVSSGLLGSKRLSLRKVLSGQMGLSGRKRSPAASKRDERFDEEEANGDEIDDSEVSGGGGVQTPTGSASIAFAPPSSHVGICGVPTLERTNRPHVVISAPPTRPSSGANSPTKERRTFLKIGQKPRPRSGSNAGAGEKDKPAEKEKYFPRSSSLGVGSSNSGGGAPSSGSGLYFRRTRTYSSSHDTQHSAASDNDDDYDDDDDRPNFAERGKNRLVNFFSTFTAPKGQGMGNPGPKSHPHLFPDHPDPDHDRDSAEEEELEAGGKPEGHEVRHASSEPMSSSFVTNGDGAGAGGARVMIDMPGDDCQPVYTGSR